MNLILVVAAIWNISLIVLIKCQDEDGIQRTLGQYLIHTDKIDRHRFGCYLIFIHNTMAYPSQDGMKEWPLYADHTHKYFQNKGDVPDKREPVQLNENNRQPNVNQHANDLEALKYENVRKKRSVGVGNMGNLRKLGGLLSGRPLKKSEYDDLVSILSGLRGQIRNQNFPESHNVFLKNILQSLMKRRFNPWAGKRSQSHLSSFHPWGGRRKKSSADETYLEPRETRPFNAWGGKRDESSLMRDNSNIRYFESRLQPLDVEFKDVDITGQNTEVPILDENKQLYSKEYGDSVMPALLQYIRRPKGNDVQYLNTSFPAGKRYSYSVWRGQRNANGFLAEDREGALNTFSKHSGFFNRFNPRIMNIDERE